jgi:hypothetical protein
MARTMLDAKGRTFRNPYNSPNPWVRQMVEREPEIYWRMKSGFRYIDVEAGEDAMILECGCCGHQAFYRPTVGAHICPDCHGMKYPDGIWRRR